MRALTKNDQGWGRIVEAPRLKTLAKSGRLSATAELSAAGPLREIQRNDPETTLRADRFAHISR
jgi:hypothetical protein